MNRKQRRAEQKQAGSPAAQRSFNEAFQHHNAGRLVEAERLYKRAFQLDPAHADSAHLLGMLAIQAGRHQEAVNWLQKAARLQPDHVELHHNLGQAWQELGADEEAIASYHRALAIDPAFAKSHNGLGSAFLSQGALADSIAGYREAIRLRPDYAVAHNNLGNALKRSMQLAAAAASFRRAVALDPDFAVAHFNLATTLLSEGNLTEGWEEYEWRWKIPQLARFHRHFAVPAWRGELASGRTLLIHSEQGFGDNLQFCRYAPIIARSGMRVVLQVEKPLVRLFGSLKGVDQILEPGQETPPVDFHCAMLSLPRSLGTTLATIPRDVPYLSADAGQIATWRGRLSDAAPGRFHVGLAWAGNAEGVNDRRRSMPPDRLAPLFDVPGVSFISLQKTGTRFPDGFPMLDFMDEMADFADTAALIAALDLVISVDTAVVHLAGALGKPVWMLDRFDPDWRWLTDRRDSPWYPTVKLYRQPEPGMWDPVLREVVEDLHSLPLRS